MFRGVCNIIRAQQNKQQYFGIYSQLNRYNFSSGHSASKIEQVLREILQTNPKCENKEIKLTDKFEDLGLDSLERVEIVAEIEEALDVTLEDEETTNILSVQDAINVFENHKE